MSDPVKPTPEEKDWIAYLKDGVTILGGFTALLVALLWYVGRQYLRGYFDGLGIGIGEVTPSTWEYGEAGIFHLTLSLSITTAIFAIAYMLYTSQKTQLMKDRVPERLRSLIVWIFLLFYVITFGTGHLNDLSRSILLLIEILLFFVYLFSPYDFIKGAQTSKNRFSALTGLSAVFLILFVHTLFFVQAFAFDGGFAAGKEQVIRQASGVRIIISEPILLDRQATTIPASNGASLYVYDSLYFLQRNDNYYFVFDKITPTCTPDRVYTIPLELVRSVEYINVPPLQPSCTPRSTPRPVPVITVTATAPLTFTSTLTPTLQATGTP